MTESNLHSASILDRARDFVPDSIAGKAAYGLSVMTLGFAGYKLVEASTAGAQEATPPVPAVLDNADVQACQDLVVGDGHTPTGQFVQSDKLRLKKGSRTMEAEVGFKQPGIMQNGALKALCSAVTKNSVQLQVVTKDALKGAKAGKTSAVPVSIKPWGKVVTLLPSSPVTQRTATTAGSPNKAKLRLPRKLTSKDIKNTRYGVLETIVSDPLLQTPHIDEANLANNVPGPMAQRIAQRIVWMKSANVESGKNSYAIKVYPAGSRTAAQKIDAMQGPSATHMTASLNRMTAYDHHGGWLKERFVVIDGERHSKFTYKTNMQVLGVTAVLDSGEGGFFFPKFSYNPKTKIHTYISGVNGNPPAASMGVFLK